MRNHCTNLGLVPLPRRWLAVVALRLALAALALGATACRPQVAEPEEPVWGKQACSHCAMLLSQKSSAAQALDAQEERYFFDDLGCLVAWQAGLGPAAKGTVAWAHLGDRWVDVAATKYRGGQSTPMDFGFVAEASGSSAWGDVQAAVRVRLAAGAAPR